MIYFYRYFEGRDSRDCLTALYCYHNCLPGNSWQCADPRLPRLGSGLDIGISIHYYHLGNYVEELTCKGEEGKRKKERGGGSPMMPVPFPWRCRCCNRKLREDYNRYDSTGSILYSDFIVKWSGFATRNRKHQPGNRLVVWFRAWWLWLFMECQGVTTGWLLCLKEQRCCCRGVVKWSDDGNRCWWMRC